MRSLEDIKKMNAEAARNAGFGFWHPSTPLAPPTFWDKVGLIWYAIKTSDKDDWMEHVVLGGLVLSGISIAVWILYVILKTRGGV